MKHDFIIVGSGPAGAALAYRLATTRAAPSVLLLEAGGKNDDVEAMRLGERYSTFVTHTHFDWGYTSVPQKHLANREVSYARGKGLGGSSAINFCFWTRGAKDDFEEWARLVGDEWFNWKNTEARYKKLEGYGNLDGALHKKYADWKPEHHGVDGPVKISDALEWEPYQEPGLKAANEEGWALNMDGNDGDPIGVAVGATTGWMSKRTTAKTAYLDSAPPNLTILTETPATKIIFEGKKAVGITAGGKDYHASKEVILSAGALDTPKLLMLSGVGPKAELEKHEIPLLADLPVGQGLKDHLHLPMSLEVKSGHNQRALLSTPEGVDLARAQLQKDGTGPLSILYNSALVGFSKGSSHVYESQAFKDLPPDVQAYINKPTIPTFEFAGMIPTYPLPGFDPTKTYCSVMAFGMCPQSSGTVTLKSSDPADPPLSDPNFLSHPFDRLVMIDAVRRTMKWLRNPTMTPDPIGAFLEPKSDSDEDIMAYIEQVGMSTWHMSCTCKMGKADDDEAVVTSDFKLKGLDGLRVADLSVTPFLPNCHTVSIGYLIGGLSAEKIANEYGLE